MTIMRNASRRALLAGASGAVLTSACTSFFSLAADTGDNALKREARDAMKRAATRGEALFATGTGTSGTPGSLVWEGTVTRETIIDALAS